MRYVDSVGTAFVTSKGQLRAVIQSRDVTGVAERPGNTSETSNELAAETRSAGKVESTDE